MALTLQHYLIVSVILFAIGATGAVVRRNVLVILMSIELMLAAVGLALLAFSRWTLLAEGAAVVFFVVAVMASEAVVGTALIIALFRLRRTVVVDEMRLLKG